MKTILFLLFFIVACQKDTVKQQRLAIARALVMEPKYLFADDPTGNLNSTNGKIIMNLFKKFNKEKGTTIIYVTHDTDFAAIADKKINLFDGVIESSFAKLS